MNNIHNGKILDESVYQHFNNFIFSNDRKILHKLLYRIELFNKVKHLTGDIVECGVFKGSGLVTWSKLIELYCNFEIKKVIGFDFFDNSFVKNLDSHDIIYMEKVFLRCKDELDEITYENVTKKLTNINIPTHKFELVKGDVSITSKEYTVNNPGFRISLLYMDLDLEEPTYCALENFWNFIVPGGLIVFDEYGYGIWTESNAVDRFIKKYNLKLYKTNVSAPTAYIIKPF